MPQQGYTSERCCAVHTEHNGAKLLWRISLRRDVSMNAAAALLLVTHLDAKAMIYIYMQTITFFTPLYMLYCIIYTSM